MLGAACTSVGIAFTLRAGIAKNFARNTLADSPIAMVTKKQTDATKYIILLVCYILLGDSPTASQTLRGISFCCLDLHDEKE